MFAKLKSFLLSTKIGKAFDALLRETSGDGFKSKCVVASYLCVYGIAKLIIFVILVLIIIFAIGTFTHIEVNGDFFIEILKLSKDFFALVVTFFAIAVTTTFGATAFGIVEPLMHHK